MDEQQVTKASHIASLIVKRMQGSLTEQESQQLQEWIAESGEHYLLYEELMNEETLGHDLDELHAINTEAALQKLSGQLFHSAPIEIEQPRKLWRYWAAAVLVLSAGATIWYLSNSKQEQASARVVRHVAQQPITGASHQTILTLTDGSSIVLDSISNGLLAEDGKIQITKLKDGQLQYLPTAGKHGAGATGKGFNTLSTGRGDLYQITLPDGTKVWLNAASSLRYPSSFSGKERKVILTGEGYFKIAKYYHEQQYVPFIVSTGNIEVQALGTDFNIKAYKEEPITQTTLVSGSAKVTLHKKEYLLQPGKKASTKNNTDSLRMDNANLEQVLAWRNGQFVFRNTPLFEIMQQLTRWYDMDVVYSTKIPSLYITGEINRQATLLNVLKMLEYAGDVHFTVHGRTITVSPVE
jgi:transmembrane sensor